MAYGSDDDHHCATEWSARVNIFSEAYEFNSEMIEFVEDLQEMAYVSGDAVERAYEYDVKAVPPRIG
jgi:hypothetical protein